MALLLELPCWKKQEVFVWLSFPFLFLHSKMTEGENDDGDNKKMQSLANDTVTPDNITKIYGWGF